MRERERERERERGEMRTKTAMCVGPVCVGAAEKKSCKSCEYNIRDIFSLLHSEREGIGGIVGGGAMAQCETKTSTENNHL